MAKKDNLFSYDSTPTIAVLYLQPRPHLDQNTCHKTTADYYQLQKEKIAAMLCERRLSRLYFMNIN